MNTAPRVTHVTSRDAVKRSDGSSLNDFNGRLHDAFGLIPSGPPRGQWMTHTTRTASRRKPGFPP